MKKLRNRMHKTKHVFITSNHSLLLPLPIFKPNIKQIIFWVKLIIGPKGIATKYHIAPKGNYATNFR